MRLTRAMKAAKRERTAWWAVISCQNCANCIYDELGPFATKDEAHDSGREATRGRELTFDVEERPW